MNKLLLLLVVALLSLTTGFSQSAAITVSSPDQKIEVSVYNSPEGTFHYLVTYNQAVVIDSSALGLQLNDGDFTRHLRLASLSATRSIKDDYQMRYYKKSSVHYQANQRMLNLVNENGQAMAVVFQVSNDAVAFRYLLTGKIPV